MYQFIPGSPGCHNLFISDVAPPMHEKLARSLTDLNRAHVLVTNGTTLTQYADIIGALDNEALDHARLSILHTLNMISEVIEKDKFEPLENYYRLKSFDNWLQYDFDNILKASQTALNEAENTPKSKSHIDFLSKMVFVLTEAQETAHMHFGQTPYVLDMIERIKDFALQYESFRCMKTHYDTLLGLVSFDELQSGATLRIEEQINEDFDFNFSRLERAMIVLGSRRELSYYVQSSAEEQNRMKKDGVYSSLCEDDCEFIKSVVNSTFKCFDKYNHFGFINRLLAMSVLLDAQAHKYLEKSDKLEADGLYEQEVESIFEMRKRMLGRRDYRQDFLDQNKEEVIAQFREDKQFCNHYSTHLLQEKEKFLQSINMIGMTLGLDNKFKNPALTLTGHIEQGFVVGQFNYCDILLFVHKDPFVDEQNAVFAGKLTKPQLDHFMQDREELVFNKEFRDYLQTVDGAKYSNFYSYAQFICEFKDEYVQNYMFGTSARLVDKTAVDYDLKAA